MSGAIWLASYPRSGNTWARMALYSLTNDGGEVDFRELGGFGQMAAGREQIDRILEVDTGLMTPREIEELRPEAYAMLHGEDRASSLTKVHDAWVRTPSGRPVFDRAFTHATLYLIRDPRDVAVSWARFVNWPVERAVAFMCAHDTKLGAPGEVGTQLEQPIGSWSNHAASWIDESGLDPLVIRYEDQLADPVAALRAMAAHIGWDAPDDAVARAVESTNFDLLAAKEKREGFTEKLAATERFFHTGKSGGWRDALPPDLAARLEREHGAMMERFGYL